MSMNDIARDINFTSTLKGFIPPNEENINQKLLLAVSEICEAQEELRDGHSFLSVYYEGMSNLPYSAGADLSSFPIDKKPEGFPIEIADAIIRLFHICYAVGIDIDQVIALKLAYNKTRPNKHGRQF